MLTRRVIPCLDVADGRVVKGVRFGNLRDAGDPVACAALYESQGADELVILDISATPGARATNRAVIADVRRVLSIPLTVGGGVRCLADAEALLDAGADKVSINTAGVERPDLISELAERVGVQCVVVAVDAARDGASWQVVTRSGAHRPGLDAIEWMRSAERLGAGEILLTSWDRDGTRAGYDLDLIASASRSLRIPIIASGGANSAEHLVEALRAGADAVLAASIFHDADLTVAQVKHALALAGQEIRT